MGNDVMLSLVTSECEDAVKRCSGGLEDKLRAAMNVAKDHWMVLDREVQFKGAVGAVMTHYGKDSWEWMRIEAELNKMRQLNAFLMAAQAGLLPSLPEPCTDEPEPIGMMKMWHDAVKAQDTK